MEKRQQLYQYSILWHPTKQESEEGKKSSILVKPDYMMASDHNSAFIQVSRLIPEKYLDKLDQVDIMVRPF